MKNFLIGLIYTVVLAGCLAHFSGCEVPEEISESLYEIAAMLTPEVAATPTAAIGSVPVPSEDGTDAQSSGKQITGNSEGTPADPAADDSLGGNGSVTETTSTETQTISSQTTPKAKSTLTPTTASTPTSVPNNNTGSSSPSSSENRDIDNVSAVLTLIPPALNEYGREVMVNTELAAADGFYYANEEEATADFFRKCMRYESFTMLFKDETCMHTPEYYMTVYPELTHVEIDYEMSTRYRNGIYVNFKVRNELGATYKYAVTTGNTAFLKDTELAAVNEIERISEKLGLDKMNDIDVVVTVHDYIINNTKYDTAYRDISHTPYGLLTEHRAVCDGYANSFLIFMLLNGIDCKTVEGVAKGESHAWNQVKLEGKWYNVDVTWDDPITTDSAGTVVDNLKYTYLLITNEELYKTHVPISDYIEECNDERYHLLMYSKYMCETEDDLFAQLEAQRNNDEIVFVYRTGAFTKEQLVSAMRKKYDFRDTILVYNPTEVRDGYVQHIFINPLK
ncbi:MAG: hypothetical protein K6G60_01810 [Lachnospiraceae bacterium]|nr:hypothetical protein [Lachnospiraceae bacterium]